MATEWAAPVPPLPPPPDRLRDRSRPKPHLTLASDRAAFAILTFGQLMIWHSQLSKAETAVQKMQPLAVAALTSLGLLCSVLLPEFFCRNRCAAEATPPASQAPGPPHATG